MYTGIKPITPTYLVQITNDCVYYVEASRCIVDEFVISSASYVLRNEQTGKDETAGSCNIIAHLIDTVIEPKEKGEYQLIVTYKIADETLIDAVKVVVM